MEGVVTLRGDVEEIVVDGVRDGEQGDEAGGQKGGGNTTSTPKEEGRGKKGGRRGRGTDFADGGLVVDSSYSADHLACVGIAQDSLV